MPTYYSVRAIKTALRGELRLNDVPLFFWRDFSYAVTSQAVNMWITGATGRLTAAFDWPQTSEQPPEIPKLELSVLAGPEPNEPALVARMEWPSDQTPGQPPEIRFPFETSFPPPSLFWPRASALALDNDTLAAVWAVLSDLHSALQKHDLARLAALLDFKAADIGMALYWPVEDAREDQRDFFKTLTETDNCTMDPLDPKELEFRLVADKRLVWVTRGKYDPALSASTADGGRFLLPVYLAPVDRRWMVVR